MKIRKMPFGYCIRGGEVCVDERDAETVRMIFDRYIKGASYERLATMLEQQQVPYIPQKRWNKNIVARILKDSHYIGVLQIKVKPKNEKILRRKKEYKNQACKGGDFAGHVRCRF